MLGEREMKGMRKFKGIISTNIVGSECEFEFEVEDDATEEDIEMEARDAAFNWISWEYDEIKKLVFDVVTNF